MNAPFSADSPGTIEVVVEVTCGQLPPTLPFELRDHISPNTWEVRMSALALLASQYCRPTLERIHLLIILVLTFLIPITTYYVVIQTLEETTTNDLERGIWLARLSSFAATLAVWILLSLPWIIWKYCGRVRVMRLMEQWTKEDALAARSYGTAPVWKASVPRLFRDAIELIVVVPMTKKSHFDRNSYLPPYVSAGDDGLPAYMDSSATWSRDPRGGVKYGDLPIYTDNRPTMV